MNMNLLPLFGLCNLSNRESLNESDEPSQRLSDDIIECSLPPPYQDRDGRSSSPTPEPAETVPVFDEAYQYHIQREAHDKTRPSSQFQLQAKRERSKLALQLARKLSGRPQTLPFDPSMDDQANAENNVRARWIEQGIWGAEWGPAWAKGSNPMCQTWRWRGVRYYAPFHRIAENQGGRWGHEEGPEPEQDRDYEQEQDISQEGTPLFANSGLFGNDSVVRPTKPAPKPIRHTLTPLGLLPEYALPRPTVRDPEASRPYHQFKYQVSQEKIWIRDGIGFEVGFGECHDLYAMAYMRVKQNWVEDGLWDSEWDDWPGVKWRHEKGESILGDASATGRDSSTLIQGSIQMLPTPTDTNRMSSESLNDEGEELNTTQHPSIVGNTIADPEDEFGMDLDANHSLNDGLQRHVRFSGPSTITNLAASIFDSASQWVDGADNSESSTWSTNDVPAPRRFAFGTSPPSGGYAGLFSYAWHPKAESHSSSKWSRGEDDSQNDQGPSKRVKKNSSQELPLFELHPQCQYSSETNNFAYQDKPPSNTTGAPGCALENDDRDYHLSSQRPWYMLSYHPILKPRPEVEEHLKRLYPDFHSRIKRSSQGIGDPERIVNDNNGQHSEHGTPSHDFQSEQVGAGNPATGEAMPIQSPDVGIPASSNLKMGGSKLKAMNARSRKPRSTVERQPLRRSARLVEKQKAQQKTTSLTSRTQGKGLGKTARPSRSRGS